jgi:hypothetical protein
MSKSRMMGAGNASASLYKTNPNINTFGGSKKQDIPTRVGIDAWANYGYQTNANGIGKNKLFIMNQIGGVGVGRSMFNTSYVQPRGLRKHIDISDIAYWDGFKHVLKESHIIPPGHTFTHKHLHIPKNKTLTNYGNMHSTDLLTIEGELINYENHLITGGMNILSTGKYTIIGNTKLESYTESLLKTLDNTGGDITGPTSRTTDLTLNGALTIESDGTLENSATIKNYSIITVLGTLCNIVDTIEKKENGNITFVLKVGIIDNYFTINVYKSLINFGTVNNYQYLNLISKSNFDNCGEYKNLYYSNNQTYSTALISGTMNNWNSGNTAFTYTSPVNNKKYTPTNDADIYIYSGTKDSEGKQYFIINGSLYNYSRIYLLTGCKLYNNGYLDNHNGIINQWDDSIINTGSTMGIDNAHVNTVFDNNKYYKVTYSDVQDNPTYLNFTLEINNGSDLYLLGILNNQNINININNYDNTEVKQFNRGANDVFDSFGAYHTSINFKVDRASEMINNSAYRISIPNVYDGIRDNSGYLYSNFSFIYKDYS